LNFSTFFDLFQWFDRKISDAIKQLLPARVNFIGGEQVVESHLLERPKYKYQYPVFHTPQEVPEMNVAAKPDIVSGSVVGIVAEGDALGTGARTVMDKRKTLGTEERKGISVPDAVMSPRFITTFSDGDERIDQTRKSNTLLRLYFSSSNNLIGPDPGEENYPRFTLVDAQNNPIETGSFSGQEYGIGADIAGVCYNSKLILFAAGEGGNPISNENLTVKFRDYSVGSDWYDYKQLGLIAPSVEVVGDTIAGEPVYKAEYHISGSNPVLILSAAFTASFLQLALWETASYGTAYLKEAYLDFYRPSQKESYEFFRTKVVGNTKGDILNPNSSINFKNDRTKRLLMEKDRDNK
jgi:hypothetical protein